MLDLVEIVTQPGSLTYEVMIFASIVYLNIDVVISRKAYSNGDIHYLI